MTSEVNWGVLGLVIELASYGAEIYQRYERRYGDVLPMRSPSHVYSALNMLESQGLVEVVSDGRVGLRQPKLRYRATLHGIRSFEDRLVAQGDALRRKKELWAREFATFSRNPDAALQLLGRVEAKHLTLITDAERARKGRRGATDLRGVLAEKLVAEQQRIGDGGTLKWLGYAREMFEVLAGGRSDGAPGA